MNTPYGPEPDTLYESLFRTLLGRENHDTHESTDVKLLLGRKLESSERGDGARCEESVFYYSVAHALKHWCRGQAADPKRKMEDSQLVSAAGWADEFFWLSIWRETGWLSGTHGFTGGRHRRLYLALLHIEWGDLILLARQLHLDNPKEVNVAARAGFGLWRTCDGEDVLLKRASKRLYTAKAELVGLEQPGGDAETSAGGAFNAILNIRKATLDNGLERAQRAEKQICDVRSKFPSYPAKTEPGHLAGVSILAEWIQDLLTEERGHAGIRHVRISLPVGSTDGPRQFPNVPVIEELRRRILEHLPWLRFATEKKSGSVKTVHEMVYEIGERSKDLKRRLNGTSSGRLHNDSKWELFMLRDWGSYTPLLPGDPRSRGGGCFLRAATDKKQPLGIVVDPGYDFIENFYDAGLATSQITHVVVTHDHYDHAVSFGPLLNLIFKCEEMQGIHFLLCRGILDQYARFIVDCDKYGAIEPLTDNDARMDRVHELGDSVTLRTTRVEHADKNGFGAGVGLVFDFGAGVPRLGITSDTGFFEEVVEDDSGTCLAKRCPLSKHFDDVQVMVLHVGSLTRDEIWKDSGFYRRHLGARGVFRCIEGLKACELALLTEFGEECRGNRSDFAAMIQEHFKSRAPSFRCFPTDRNTRVVCTDDGLLVGRSRKLFDVQAVTAEEKEVGIEFKLA